MSDHRKGSEVSVRIIQATPSPDQSRVRVILSDGHELSVPYPVYLSFQLFVDREIDGHELAAVDRQCEFEAAKEKALRMIRYGDRSQRECRTQLAKTFSAGVVDDVIHDLIRLGLLDDRRFVQQTVEKAQGRGWGRKRIVFELTRRGLDHQVVSEACGQLSEDDELSKAVAWLQHQIGNKQLDNPAVQRRLLAALLRRGFGYAIARKALGSIANTDSTDDWTQF